MLDLHVWNTWCLASLRVAVEMLQSLNYLVTLTVCWPPQGSVNHRIKVHVSLLSLCLEGRCYNNLLELHEKAKQRLILKYWSHIANNREFLFIFFSFCAGINKILYFWTSLYLFWGWEGGCTYDIGGSTGVPTLLVTMHGPVQHTQMCRGQSPPGQVRRDGQACESVSSSCLSVLFPGTCDSHPLVKLRAAGGTNGILIAVEDLILNYIVLP